MSNRIAVALVASLLLPAVACVEADGEPDPELSEEASELLASVCRHDTSVHVDDGVVTLFTRTYEVTAGAPLLMSADLTGSVAASSGSSNPMQGLYIQCSGPVTERIQTTQNAVRGQGAITTKAHLALTVPGTYSCSLQTSTTHDGARLDISRACLYASATAAQDWPNYPADSTAVGRGIRIYKGDPQYVLRHDYDLDASTSRLAIRADIELTDIEEYASGIGDPPPGDPILLCEELPYTPEGPATARVRVEATQRAVGGWCGATAKGPNVDTVISARTHHQKIYAGLDLPISRASGCLPRVNVKVYVSALGTGNDLCFHASRYSNTYIYPL